MFSENQDLVVYTLLFVTFSLFTWNIAQQFAISAFKKRQQLLFQGKNAQSLEEIIITNQKAWASADKDISDLYEITTKVHELAHLGLHKIGMIRFNPFRDIGGDQSFSIALLDGEDNGLVLSSIYSRDGVRVYTKAIQGGISEKHPLTEEEKRAIIIASSVKISETKRKTK